MNITPLQSDLHPPAIIKLGGSLYDLSDLKTVLKDWLESNVTGAFLLVPGGGAFADAVRHMDQVHGLGQEASHWLALQSLVQAASFLEQLLPLARTIHHFADWQSVWSIGLWPVLNAFEFARQDDALPDALPHTWEVTSDSIAAQVARRMEAKELIFLKSVSKTPELSWLQAAQAGLVDGHFGNSAQQILPSECRVRWVNLRAVTCTRNERFP